MSNLQRLKNQIGSKDIRNNKDRRAQKAHICQSVITLKGRRQSRVPEQEEEMDQRSHMQRGHLKGYFLYVKIRNTYVTAPTSQHRAPKTLGDRSIFCSNETTLVLCFQKGL